MVKEAKTAHKKAALKRADAAEAAAGRLVIVSDGHRVSHNVTGKTDCGEWLLGWRYGEAKDVACKHCIDGTQKGDIDVPPAYPDEFEGHRANEDTVPIYCYKCGDEWPCAAVLSSLPILSMEALGAESPA